MALNDVRLPARTSLPMKSMEKLIKKQTVQQVEKWSDPFLIWSSRGVEDAVRLKFPYAHLEGQKTRFVDFSLAFKTLCPHTLADTMLSYD